MYDVAHGLGNSRSSKHCSGSIRIPRSCRGATTICRRGSGQKLESIRRLPTISSRRGSSFGRGHQTPRITLANQIRAALSRVWIWGRQCTKNKSEFFTKCAGAGPEHAVSFRDRSQTARELDDQRSTKIRCARDDATTAYRKRELGSVRFICSRVSSSARRAAPTDVRCLKPTTITETRC